MPHDPIHTGYARGLLEMAEAEQVTGRVEEELYRLRDLLKGNPELLSFLKDAGIAREGKRAALAELFQGRVHPLVLNVLLTLSDQDRIGRLPAVIEEFSALAGAARQSVVGEVVTAVALDDAAQSRLAAELSRLTGKNVRLVQKVDPGVIGGAVIKVGEQVVDGSLQRRLELMKERLAEHEVSHV
jgi:F-type H+-transporting ATPase subunit delta